MIIYNLASSSTTLDQATVEQHTCERRSLHDHRRRQAARSDMGLFCARRTISARTRKAKALK
jgi:hypothetical protein